MTEEKEKQAWEGFTKEITFAPAFDKKAEGYGIGGVSITFVLKGPKGATQFNILTDWYLPHTQRELKTKGFDMNFDNPRPMGADIGYHSPIPQYEEQQALTDDCKILGGKCYYDGSSLQAHEFIPEFLAGGSDAVWTKLREVYDSRFES